MDCGPACLAMIAGKYGRNYSLQYLRDNSFITKDGVSLSGMTEAAKKIGFETVMAKLTIEKMKQGVPLPCICHWNQNHFVVLYKVKKNLISGDYVYYIADPAHGLASLNEKVVRQSWISDDAKGIALFLKPGKEFYRIKDIHDNRFKIKYFTGLVAPHAKLIAQLFLGLLAGSLISFVFPFLAQTLIDKGVNSRNLNIVYIILLAQIFLFLGIMAIEVVRNWITLYVGARISMTIVSDFLRKILRLPIRFYDTKLIGDFSQRFQDQEKIESFFSSHSLITFFSIIHFCVFFFVLMYYNVKIVFIYTILTIAAIAWSVLFLRKRKVLDYFRFQNRSENQESIYEMINGIQEIKLNSFENYKRKRWEQIQLKLFNINLRILRLDQLQLTGFDFINQLKNILVTFISAREVILGNITLGTMLSISYIIGQMNAPIGQLISFFRTFQDAKVSMERMSEVQSQPEEENQEHLKLPVDSLIGNETDTERGIASNNLSFQYEGPHSPFVLNDIDLFIPEGKVVAIVGASGSGKTTLMKLLLKFYDPVIGDVFINQFNLKDISPVNWRENTGVVMQDGYIFSDSIERNIAMSDEAIEYDRLEESLKIANIYDFVYSLPLKLKTKVGAAGIGLSGGQKQRLLIARAVYKNPHFIFFDEATSALDADNEFVIHHNLLRFFKGKTVVLIAHRLSTVKNADQIIVLKEGKIVEQGDHQELVTIKGNYFNLVKNQLELGG